MRDNSWSWGVWRQENFPSPAGEPRFLDNKRTCVLPVKLEPHKFYATWINNDHLKDFVDAEGRPALTYLLTFTTGASNAPMPRADELAGKLVFHGHYRHRSRGREFESPSELWVKASADGSLNALADVPFMKSSDLASGDSENQLISYRSGSNPSGNRKGFSISLKLADGKVFLTRRGVRASCDNKEIEVPKGAWFDPNSRPDSYCAANILLRAFALSEGQTKEFHVYDWDNQGEGFADYNIRVAHKGKEKVQVPAGTFEANHLVLTQTSSGDTWFKKRAGHITEFWVLDNHVIIRVLRHREPYEMVLLDYDIPEKLGDS